MDRLRCLFSVAHKAEVSAACSKQLGEHQHPAEHRMKLKQMKSTFRVIESTKLEKSFKVIKSNSNHSMTAKSAIKPCQFQYLSEYV